VTDYFTLIIGHLTLLIEDQSFDFQQMKNEKCLMINALVAAKGMH